MQLVTESNRIVYSLGIAVAGSVTFSLLAWLWTLRESKLVQNRNIFLVTLHVGWYFVFFLGFSLGRILNLECLPYYALILIPLAGTIVGLFGRMKHTWAEYVANADKLDYYKQRPQCPVQCRLKRAKMKHSRKIAFIINVILASIPFLIATAAVIGKSIEASDGELSGISVVRTCDKVFRGPAFATLVSLVVMIILTLKVLYQLNKIVDSVGIVKEYFILLASEIGFVAYGNIYVFHGAQGTINMANDFDIFAFLFLALPYFATIYFTLWIPIQQARAHQAAIREASTKSKSKTDGDLEDGSKTSKDGAADKETLGQMTKQLSSRMVRPSKKTITFKELTDELSKVLHDSSQAELFSSFLKSEFSVENYLFWRDVENFREGKRLNDQQTFEEHAKFISEQFIHQDSPLSVNISTKSRSEILKNIEDSKFEITMFDAAQKEVFVLMARDSYTRFRISVARRETAKEPTVSRKDGESNWQSHI